MGTDKAFVYDDIEYQSIAHACRALDVSYQKVSRMMRGGATFAEVMHRIINKISDVKLILENLSIESAVSAKELWTSLPGLQHRTVDSVQATLRDMAIRELVVSERDKRPMVYRLPNPEADDMSEEDKLRFCTAWAPLRPESQRCWQR